jgi:integrase
LGDIRTLRLDELKWDTAAIEITQSKTGAPLCLPMTEEVGEALIDYLKSGRPQTAHRELFLRAQPPFTPLADDGHFYQIVKYWRELAGIRFPGKQHAGLRECATLSWKLKRLPRQWFDDDASRNQAADERSRDGKSATNGQETQEVASTG